MFAFTSVNKLKQYLNVIDLFFTGLRIARMHWDALKYADSGPTTVLLHSTFISPLLVTALWIKPLSRDYLTDRIYSGMSAPL